MPIKYKLSGLDEVGKDVAQNMRNTFRTKLEKLGGPHRHYKSNGVLLGVAQAQGPVGQSVLIGQFLRCAVQQ